MNKKKRKKRIIWLLIITVVILLLACLFWFFICPCMDMGGASADNLSNSGDDTTEPSSSPPNDTYGSYTPSPPPDEPDITLCNSECQADGYDFGIANTVVCKFPFSANIALDVDLVCCCGDFVNWGGDAYYIENEDDWCFDSDLNTFDRYTVSGFCVDNTTSDGLWDDCVAPVDEETDILEAFCMGTSCVYEDSTSCDIEGATDDCFTSNWGDFCAEL